jgi:predicted nucleic acid-binding protein
MADNLFVDTNVLIYANNGLSPFSSIARAKLNEALDNYERLWISRQVIREFAVVVSREMLFAGSLDYNQLDDIVQQFERNFWLAEDDQMVTKTLFSLIAETQSAGKQVHDANIVATMLVHGIEALLTHNTSDFKRFSHLIEVIPLV